MTGQPLPAVLELRALAAATRPDWDAGAVADALVRAQTAGMTWGQVLAVMGRLMGDPEATPGELADESPRPWQAPSPGDYDRGAALARAALRDAHHTDNHPGGGRAR
jgi:hypothetical protein